MAVEGLRPLASHPWTAIHMSPSMRRAQVQRRLVIHQVNVNTTRSKHIRATKCVGSWICRADDNAGDASVDQGLGARAGSTRVCAGFKRDIGGCAASGGASDVYRVDFCMCLAAAPMSGERNQLAFGGHNRTAHRRVGGDETMATRCSPSCQVQPVAVYSCAHEPARTSFERLGGMMRYSAGSIELLARPWVMPRSTVV